MASQFKSGSTKYLRPLIVSDEGVAKLGIVDQVSSSLKQVNPSVKPVVFDKTQPNPSYNDVKEIARLYLNENCDGVIGVGGGGPLDAMKGGMAIVAFKKLNQSFDLDKDSGDFITNKIRPLLRSVPAGFTDAVPQMSAIPTTAGTGSEGGKSAVITDVNGVKLVFGHPVFFPKYVALAPQLTEKLPPALTAGTGIDALFHLTEAWCVTHAAGINDGLDDAGIARCDKFATDGIDLVLKYLPKAFSNGSDLDGKNTTMTTTKTTTNYNHRILQSIHQGLT
eukprot:TRINITY_DN635_c0_g2_i2.p1 TRINITY_DN635_c0_g2~~TRINITY_DN635_c0_g2_i2.p1  ORF type:complete len:322 (+),score=103.02 TRINITY_DN635_c0_g2_i2:131-967(+)